MKPHVLVYPTVLVAALTVFLGAMDYASYATIAAALAFFSSLLLLAAIRREMPKHPPATVAQSPASVDSHPSLTDRDTTAELESLRIQNASYAAALEELKAERARSASQGLSDEQAVIQFVRNLQERGRFIDFLMADIHALPDQQVGAAARLVHSGLRSLIDDYFSVQAIATADEGTKIPIPNEELGRSYRLLQSSSDVIPPSGILVHKGWRARTIKLPQSQRLEAESERRVLAFVEVDVKVH
jgi:hypothetical protein